MNASMGNLDGLLNYSFSDNDFSNLAVQSYTTSGTLLNEAVSTLDATAVGPVLPNVGYTFTVVAVDSSANQITIDTFYQSQPISSTTYYVAGFSGKSILLSIADPLTLVAELKGGSLELVNSDLSAITLSPPSVGENLSFSATGTFGGSTPCFLQGTTIQTDRGNIVVERLRVGDRVPAHFAGGTAQIAWIGHRTLNVARHPRPWDVAPVRIRAGAFGSGVPRRDLILSPDHAVLVEGALVPVRYLLNGATIVQEPAGTVTYFHVELEAHDVLLAEGLPVESYLDTGNRSSFANAPGHTMLAPDFARQVWAERSCAPLILDGPVVQAERRRLIAVACLLGWDRTTDSNLRVRADDSPAAAVWHGSRCRVALPPGTRRVVLRSRSGVPAETHSNGRDGRRLGVALSDLRVDRAPIADAAFAAGWHGQEDGWRWTDGNGALDVNGARELTFAVARTETYWLPPARKVATALV